MLSACQRSYAASESTSLSPHHARCSTKASCRCTFAPVGCSNSPVNEAAGEKNTGGVRHHPPAPRPPRRAPSHLTRPPRARRDGLLSQLGYDQDFYEARRKPGKESVPRAESWSWPARGWEGAIIVRGGRVYLSAVSASYEGRFSMMASSYVIGTGWGCRSCPVPSTTYFSHVKCSREIGP